MVIIPPELAGAYQYAANIFQIRPEWLVFPNILTIFLIPLFFNVWMFYIFLAKIARVFGGSGVNWVIAGIIGFLVLPWNNILIYISPAIIGFFGFSSWPVRILMIVLLYGINLFLIPWLTNLAVTGFRV